MKSIVAFILGIVVAVIITPLAIPTPAPKRRRRNLVAEPWAKCYLPLYRPALPSPKAEPTKREPARITVIVNEPSIRADVWAKAQDIYSKVLSGEISQSQLRQMAYGGFYDR